MELQLTLTAPARLLGGRIEATLRDGEMVIGRASEADWSIPDPERVISKIHCRIAREFDGFQLTDLSTNGVRINDVAVGYGQSRRVNNGDVVKLGDAIVTARISTVPQPASPPSQQPQQPIADIPDDGPFGRQASESPELNPVAERQPQVAGASTGAVLDDWWGPVGGSVAETDAIPVDISTQQVSPAIEDVHSAEETVRSQDNGVASLLRTVPGLDVEKLAQVVEEATAVLSAGERIKFRDRLSAIVRNASLR